ncbi:hypothetical protein OCOL_001655 [Ordospora colligata]|uniref:Uncharacterized protein n=1 Tax=Ordospora colligata OC4 TaxID=1354746 RepID=A0A0B2UIA8_9MICR|nr:uncharacterized protein M896_090220 [Ordospora colligata OC4]KHN69098.1 hypothetical protein M896_090220 [Ordospora colligata OC4]TBU14553.1 hypothetical protein CWI41_090220 [Ordospora colligata]TBU14747.1 hypothetical protein CWI40_090230 [Ordospora colligata]
MQLQIPRINKTNYERILREIRQADDVQGVADDIRNVMLLMPHKSSIIASLMCELIKDSTELKNAIIVMLDGISKTTDICEMMSAVFTLKRLGVGWISCFSWIGQLPESFMVGEHEFEVCSKGLVDECNAKADAILGRVNKEDFEDTFCIMQIIRNFRFSVQECVMQLNVFNNHKQVVDSLLLLYSEGEDVLYLTMVVIELCKKQGFMKTFVNELCMMSHEVKDKECKRTIGEFKRIALPFIFEYFLYTNEESSVYASSSYVPLGCVEDIAVFKQAVNDEVRIEMERISGLKKVKRFFEEDINGGVNCLMNKISKEEFEAKVLNRDYSNGDVKDGVENKEFFFRNFCYLGSPSISHFLTYLEMYKSYFRLEADDQQLFIDVFLDVFKSSESFRRIVLEKMVLFGIVQKDVVDCRIEAMNI